MCYRRSFYITIQNIKQIVVIIICVFFYILVLCNICIYIYIYIYIYKSTCIKIALSLNDLFQLLLFNLVFLFFSKYEFNYMCLCCLSSLLPLSLQSCIIFILLDFLSFHHGNYLRCFHCLFSSWQNHSHLLNYLIGTESGCMNIIVSNCVVIREMQDAHFVVTVLVQEV